MKTSPFSLPSGLLRLVIIALLAGNWLANELPAAPPIVSNVRAAQRAGTHLVDIYYDVSDPDGDNPLTIALAISANAGASYDVPVYTLSGAVGPGVVTGTGRHIVWNAGVDWPGQFNTQCRVRIVADDGTSPPGPPNMVYIPGGTFEMGDALFNGRVDELPVHTVYVSPFFMDKFEVKRELWLDVYSWAIGHGYDFESGGLFGGGNGFPVESINWFDAVKWCNARSEKTGFTPVYYTDMAQTIVYRAGRTNLQNANVKWTGTGFRLPTEAEWEKAARGGLRGHEWPWESMDLNPFYANYNQTHSPQHIDQVGIYLPNSYGLYDMAGNVLEYCWDWYDSFWYGKPEASASNPHGPEIQDGQRVSRGGSFFNGGFDIRCAARAGLNINSFEDRGFRCVKGL